MKKGMILGATLMAATLGGCSEYNRTDRTIAGGLIGAGTGAAIGSLSGNAGAGALIGGVGGAVIGNVTTPRCRAYYRNGRCRY